MIKRADNGTFGGYGGGNLPTVQDVPAFFVVDPQPSLVPILIAAPHAGRYYPDALMADLRHGPAAALKLEDRHIDAVARRVAAETGAGLIVANAPRALIDLNRAPDDLDPEMFARDAMPESGWPVPTMRARGGLGLVPRRLPAFGDLWRRRFTGAELQERLTLVHEPYHAALSQKLLHLHERWGAALLIDLHSMPPLPRQAGSAAAQFVIGDRFGASCGEGLVAAAFRNLAQAGRASAHNRPYAGGYVLERHARPGQGIHAFQLEVDRSCYLDEAMKEIGPGIDNLVADIGGLVRTMADLVTALGSSRPSSWPLAAE